MKLPNDLIKATDYSKAKDREIHEFEYRNGKYIQKYVLGGEHELTSQEVVDCLNGLATIDCDLQTAYAFIQSQKDKIADLEAKLAEMKESCVLLEGLRKSEEEKKDITMKRVSQLKQQLADTEAQNKRVLEKLDLITRSNQELEKQLAEKDKEFNWLHQKFAKYVEKDQDKISFCIEKLEKVKTELVNEVSPICLSYTEYVQEVFNKLNTQIKELKKEIK